MRSGVERPRGMARSQPGRRSPRQSKGKCEAAWSVRAELHAAARDAGVTLAEVASEFDAAVRARPDDGRNGHEPNESPARTWPTMHRDADVEASVRPQARPETHGRGARSEGAIGRCRSFRDIRARFETRAVIRRRPPGARVLLCGSTSTRLTHADSSASGGLNDENHQGRVSVPYVRLNTVSVSHLLNDSLSMNCLNSSVSSFRTAVMTRAKALSCSIFAFCLSECLMAF